MISRLAAAVLLLAVAVPACKDTVVPNEGDSPSNIVFPARDVSFTYHLQPLFNQACNFGGCHDGGAHQSPLKLTGFGDLVLTIPGMVVSGQPDQSMLVFRIEGRVGQRMPPGNYPLNQNQINGIRTWVAEGAKNN
jgi:hypothetical protein